MRVAPSRALSVRFHHLRRARARVVAAVSKEVLLPNGFTVFPVSDPDIPFLYVEVFVQSAYVSHGIRLAPGDTVLDIGANVGMFALKAASLVSPGGRVLCFEPAPRAYAALRRTLAANAADARVRSVDVRALQVAVADTTGTALLTEYPHAAGWSTLSLCVDDAETAANVGAYAQAADAHEVLATAPSGLRPFLALFLAPLRRTGLYTAAVQLLSRRMLRGAREVRCEVVTVSQLLDSMAAHVPGFKCVDLLKIDVERAELDVLRGITSQRHWASIRQAVLEVHDTDGRLGKVMQLLRQDGGFATVTSVQPSNLVGSNLYVVYATR